MRFAGVRAEATAKAEGAPRRPGKTKRRTEARNDGCIGFFPGEEALACRASLRCHLDSAMQRSVSLIETALQCEMVAENTRCQVLPGTWAAAGNDRRIHEGMD